MRVRDGEKAVYRGLLGLPWRQYLAAMWILCGELRSMYAEWLRDEEDLIGWTMNVVREVAVVAESSETAMQAAELEDEWDHVYTAREDEASGGLCNVFVTFEALAIEIGDRTQHYFGASSVMNAATERWRVEDTNIYEPIFLDPDEIVDESSPMAKTVTTFQLVIGYVNEVEGPDWDPIVIRAQIFDERQP